MEWEKMPENHIYDKELMFKIWKEFLQLNNKKPNDLIKKWSKGSEQTTYIWSMGYENNAQPH